MKFLAVFVLSFAFGFFCARLFWGQAISKFHAADAWVKGEAELVPEWLYAKFRKK